MDSRKELADTDEFGQVVVGTYVQGFHFRGLLTPRGDDGNRN